MGESEENRSVDEGGQQHELAGKTRAELDEIARERGLTPGEFATKDDVVAAIESHALPHGLAPDTTPPEVEKEELALVSENTSGRPDLIEVAQEKAKALSATGEE